MIDSIVQDVRFCFRMLWKNPGFTIVAVITLALGISINTAVFSIVNSVLFRPLPVKDGERAVAVSSVVQRETLERRGTSYLDYLDWRAQNRVFEETAAYTGDSFTLTGLGQGTQVRAEAVSGSYFSVTGAKPVIGRIFLPGEERVPLADPAVLISHGFWVRHFGKDQNAIGKIIQLQEQNFQIIGVLPERFAGMDGNTEVWIPMAAYTLLGEPRLVENRGTRQIGVVALLKHQVTLKQAQDEMSIIAKRLENEYPDTNKEYGAIVVPLREELFGQTKSLVLTLLGAVLFVLLIACANVANLLVARATARQKEIALRTALGAGRNRILRQLITESMLLCVMGGIGGWLLAIVFVETLVAFNPVQLPPFVNVELDSSVLLFTLAICLFSGFLMGLTPAFHASRQNLQEAIKEGAANTTAALATKDVRNILVIAEVALAVLLLVGAGLLARSFLRIQNIPLGFEPEQRLAFRLSIPRVKYEGPKTWEISKQILQRIETIPSVSTASMTSDIPLEGSASAFVISLENPVLDRAVRIYGHAVSPKFFSTMAIPIKSGRAFRDIDSTDSLPVAIVSEKMVQRYWKNDNPIGKRVKLGRTLNNDRPWITIVGVAAEMKHRAIVDDPAQNPDDPEIYFPLSQRLTQNVGVIVKTEKDPSSIATLVRQELQSVDPNISLFNMITMPELVRSQTASSRFIAYLMIVFGVLALTLSAIGIYGVLTFHVTQRTREIGVRLALGASPVAVFKMILRYAMLLTTIGLSIGLVAAQGLSSLLETQLYRISPHDPFIFSSIPILLLVVSIVAIVVPARRAMTVEPVLALRTE